MGQVLIAGLAVLWLAVLAPPLLRARASQRRSNDLSDYCRSLSKLGRGQVRSGAARSVATPATARQRAARRRAAQRRRRVFGWLGGTTGGTFVLAAVSGSRPMWMLCGVALAALLAYTALVAHFQRGATATLPVPLAPVAYLPARVPARVPREYALRRTASS